MTRLLALALLIFALVVVSAEVVRAANYRDVIINELNWAGSSKSTADEWIELKNLTDAVAEISGWRIEGAATSSGTLVLPSGSMIAANGFFLISNFAETDSRSTLAVTPDWVTTSVSLRNSDVFYRLTDTASKHIDEADDGNSSPLAGDNTAKVSMERNRYVGGGTVAGGWHSSYQTVNFDTGTSQFGTPKADNNALPTVTLGRISPGSTASLEKNLFKLDYEIYDPDGISDITLAQVDLRELGANLFDLNIQSAFAQYIIEPVHAGERVWTITVADRQGGTLTLTKTLPVFQNPEKVIISEVMPRPAEGSEFEWIELFNTAGHPVSLSGLMLDDIADAGSKPYSFPAQSSISAGQFLVIEKSEHKLNLNDDGDLVRLLDPAGYVVNQTPEWSSAPKGQSFALIDGVWQWTTQITKGGVNQSSPKVTDNSPATPVPDVEPITTPGVEPEEQAAEVNATALPPPAELQRSAGQSPSRVQPSKKLVRGVKITTRIEPTARRRQPPAPIAVGLFAFSLVVQESVLVWSKRRIQPGKRSNSAAEKRLS